MRNIYPLITILSVRQGVKPIGRIDSFSKRESDFYIEKMKNLSLYYKIVDKLDNVKSKVVQAHIYFSKNKKNKIEMIDKLIELYQKENHDKKACIDTNRAMGRLYGYPDCCIDWFVKFLVDWLAKDKKNGKGFIEPNHTIEISEILANSKGNLFDIAINCCQGDNPISHLPHSFNCEKSIAIGQENLKILKKYDRKLFSEYQDYLKGAFQINRNRIIKIKNPKIIKKKNNNNIIYFNGN